jgi:methyl-accepting chemotaxis protein
MDEQRLEPLTKVIKEIQDSNKKMFQDIRKSFQPSQVYSDALNELSKTVTQFAERYSGVVAQMKDIGISASEMVKLVPPITMMLSGLSETMRQFQLSIMENFTNIDFSRL